MNSSLGEFGKTAQKLARNPLGIIALFIVLVYGIAALVLGISSNNLQPYERLPLIYFLVIFPVVVLLAFYQLVSKHHVKLYAPNDFQDKEGFFRALSPLEQKQKLDEEIKSIEEETKSQSTQIDAAAMKEAGSINPVTTRHAYVLAEELAFREIEREFGVYVHRQVAIGSDYGVDGVFQYGDKTIAVEVKYSKHSENIRTIMRREIDRFLKFTQSVKNGSVFLLVVVADGWTLEQRKNTSDILTITARESKMPVKLRIYDFDELKAKYGVLEKDSR